MAVVEGDFHRTIGQLARVQLAHVKVGITILHDGLGLRGGFGSAKGERGPQAQSGQRGSRALFAAEAQTRGDFKRVSKQRIGCAVGMCA